MQSVSKIENQIGKVGKLAQKASDLIPRRIVSNVIAALMLYLCLSM